MPPPGPPHTSDDNAAGAESVSESKGPCDNDVLQQAHTETEISPPESTRVPLSLHQPEASGSTALSADSKAGATLTESTLAHVNQDLPKAPIASIPELQLDDEKVNISEISTPESTGVQLSLPQPEASGSTALSADSKAGATLTESTLAHVNQDLPKAPIASIPELQLDDQKVNIPEISPPESTGVQLSLPQPEASGSTALSTDSKAGATLTESSAHVNQDLPNAPIASIPELQLHDEKVNISEISPPESTRVQLSLPQPEATGSTALSADSKAGATLTESTLPPRTDTDVSAPRSDSATGREEVSVSRAERSSFPDAAKSVTTASGDGSKQRPRSQALVYGELYDSLFPQNFTSEAMSSPSYPPPPPLLIHSESIEVNIKSEPVMVKTLNECPTETDVISSHLSSSHTCRLDDAESRYNNTNANPHDFQMDSNTYRPSSLVVKDVPYSEWTSSLSHGQSDGLGLIHDTVRSVPVLQNPPPPVSDYAASHGAETQVTGSQQRVILVKELVTEEASANSGCVSPVPDKMSALESLEIQIETPEFLYAASGSGPPEWSEGPLSPAYLSVGSDDGSAMEVYYSAEENNEEESEEEELFAMYEREEVDFFKEREWGEVVERERSKRDEGEFRGVIVKMQSEGDEGNDMDLISQTEEEQQLPRGQVEEPQVPEREMSEYLVSNDAKWQGTEVTAAVLPQIKEEEEEEAEETEEEEEEEEGRELLATPVQQVMECEVAPPSSEPPHVQGKLSERNWTRDLETEAHLSLENQLPSQETGYRVSEDDSSPLCEPAAPCDTREEDVITPTCREEQVSPGEDERAEAGREINSSAHADPSAGAEVVAGIATHSPELRSDATEIENNSYQQRSEWEDPITESEDIKQTVPEQVEVELSTPSVDTHRPDPELAEESSEGHEHPAEAEPDLTPG